jgi:hypothetical protein
MHVTIGDDAALLHQTSYFTADLGTQPRERVTETMTQYGFWCDLDSGATGGPSQ